MRPEINVCFTLYCRNLRVMNTVFRSLLVAVIGLGVVTADGQTSVKIMSYNTLNFPLGIMPNRQDTLKKILNYAQPDLLVLQEMRSAMGYNLIIDHSVVDLPGNYAASTHVPNQSSSSPLNQLTHGIVYNTEVFGLAKEYWRTTHLRDINIYKLYFAEAALATGGDTTFVYTFVTHLKAGTGSNNQQQRLDMTEVFVDELGNLPVDSYVLFAGDFNVYNSNEPAYQLMLSAENPIVMEDPIDAPGNWASSNYPFREIHTQCTRTEVIFGDGVGGGMDDRFDFILVSSNLKSAESPVRYKSGTYKALGNNGTCHNQNITDCELNNDVPGNILRALYHFSDHLPVVMEIELDFALSAPAKVKAQLGDLLYSAGKTIYMRNTSPFDVVQAELYDVSGRMVARFSLAQGGMHNMGDVPSGVYVAVLRESQKAQIITRQKLFLH